MSRPFFKGEYGVSPEEPTCSSCGNPNPKYIYEDGDIRVCDESCYVDWFLANEAEDLAKERFSDNCYEIEAKG